MGYNCPFFSFTSSNSSQIRKVDAFSYTSVWLKRLWNYIRNVRDLKLLLFLSKCTILIKTLVSSYSKVEKSHLWYKRLGFLLSIVKEHIHLSRENVSLIKNRFFFKLFYLTSSKVKENIISLPYARWNISHYHFLILLTCTSMKDILSSLIKDLLQKSSNPWGMLSRKNYGTYRTLSFTGPGLMQLRRGFRRAYIRGSS